jgi:hypothetical protein
MRPRLTSNCFADPAGRAPSLRPNAFRALVAFWCGAVLVELVDIFILTLIRDPLVELLDLIEDRLLKPWQRKNPLHQFSAMPVPANIAVM